MWGRKEGGREESLVPVNGGREGEYVRRRACGGG